MNTEKITAPTMRWDKDSCIEVLLSRRKMPYKFVCRLQADRPGLDRARHEPASSFCLSAGGDFFFRIGLLLALRALF
jgi:hypothetical protein